MTSSSSLVPAHTAPTAPRLAWSFQLGGQPRGLILAREKGDYYVWDENDWLYLLNRCGVRQAQVRAPAPVSAIAGADDGSAYAVVGREGGVWWLAPDLMPRWQRNLKAPAVGVAVDPLGQYLAVSETRGRLYLFDRFGRLVSRAETPRPLQHLAFVPEAPCLVGSADFGLVACYDPQGHCIWRDGLVAHIGSIAVSGDGSRILLACFSDGLRGYDLAGRKQGRLALSEPCRLAAISADGRRLLAAGLRNQIHELDPEGQVLRTLTLDHQVLALTFGALGRDAAVSVANGSVLGFVLGGARR